MDHGKMALNFFQHIKGRRPFNEIHVITDRALVIAASELLRTHLVFRFEGGELQEWLTFHSDSDYVPQISLRWGWSS